MRRATVEELAQAPVGRYVAGASFAHFCAAPELWGVILWGRPSFDDARQLGRSLVLELAAPARPHVSIIDATRLDATDPRAFAAAAGYLRHNAAALAAWVQRVAVVRPTGISGAIMAGAFDVLQRPYPVAVFDSTAAGFTWLGIAAPPALEAIYAEAAGVAPDIGALRAVLDAELDRTSLERAAKRLGVSPRSLQRKLAEAGTTFKAELAEARIRVAKRLLAETATPLTEIAFEVGCASLQSFSALFRRYCGEAPSSYRDRTRRDLTVIE